MDIYKILFDLSYGQIKNLFESHLTWSKANDRVSGNPKWFDEPGTLNVIGVRCNSEADFNKAKYNDYLVLVFNKPLGKYDVAIIDVTVDPNREKEGIAHLRQGVWNAYCVGIHGQTTGHNTRDLPGIGHISRWALRQDNNEVEIVRTDGKGNVIKSVRGSFGINVHDNGGYKDSSAGCTVIKRDEDYIEKFLPYTYDVHENKKVPVNHDDITYCLINHSNLEKYLNEKIERLESTNEEHVSSPGAEEGMKN